MYQVVDSDEKPDTHHTPLMTCIYSSGGMLRFTTTTTTTVDRGLDAVLRAQAPETSHKRSTLRAHLIKLLLLWHLPAVNTLFEWAITCRIIVVHLPTLLELLICLLPTWNCSKALPPSIPPDFRTNTTSAPPHPPRSAYCDAQRPPTSTWCTPEGLLVQNGLLVRRGVRERR